MSEQGRLAAQLHLVLRHDAVLNRQGNTIHTSVTQVDLHDFARLTRTYGLAGFHCVTPLPSQQALCREMLGFWRTGFGTRYNPDRTSALDHAHLHTDFESCLAQISAVANQPPWLLGTSAKPQGNLLEFPDVSTIIGNSGRSVVIQFGTGWGLSQNQLDRCDWVLPPVQGCNGYNHLSVRCAAAIIVDRVLHPRHVT